MKPSAAVIDAATRLKGEIDGTFLYKAYRGSAPPGVPVKANDIRTVVEFVVPVSQDAQSSIGWVLERADSSPAEPLYYAPYGAHGEQWARSPDDALRLSREIDASMLGIALGVQVRVAEHQWG